MKNNIIIWHANSRIKNFKSPSLVTIGMFDGVHKGHQELLEYSKKLSVKNNKPFYVITFMNSPKAFIKKTNPQYIDPFNRKLRKINRLVNPDLIIAIDFDEYFASLSWQEFHKHLMMMFSVEDVIVGSDFRYGNKALGSIETLSKDFNLFILDTVLNEGTKIGSTSIKQLFKNGKMFKANNLLSSNFRIVSKVIHGNKFARKLGFPTINLIYPENQIRIKEGIYSGYCFARGKYFKAAINFSKIFHESNNNNFKLEAHLIGFNEIIYGEEVKLYFSNFIRGPIKFTNQKELIDKIKEDVSFVKKNITI